ncbi:hypothetical protein F5Y16DRAFT_384576 [Xylariaceae sp. FL0255]|nr:hypothetical protein F5Y16DRAFT_384576 [Xylariaceae sp. FL0255]
MRTQPLHKGLGFNSQLGWKSALFSTHSFRPSRRARKSDQAAATASGNFIRTLGRVWGVAITAAIFDNKVDSLLADGGVTETPIRTLLANRGAYQQASANFIR